MLQVLMTSGNGIENVYLTSMTKVKVRNLTSIGKDASHKVVRHKWKLIIGLSKPYAEYTEIEAVVLHFKDTIVSRYVVLELQDTVETNKFASAGKLIS